MTCSHLYWWLHLVLGWSVLLDWDLSCVQYYNDNMDKLFHNWSYNQIPHVAIDLYKGISSLTATWDSRNTPKLHNRCPPVLNISLLSCHGRFILYWKSSRTCCWRRTLRFNLMQWKKNLLNFVVGNRLQLALCLKVDRTFKFPRSYWATASNAFLWRVGFIVY